MLPLAHRASKISLPVYLKNGLYHRLQVSQTHLYVTYTQCLLLPLAILSNTFAMRIIQNENDAAIRRWVCLVNVFRPTKRHVFVSPYLVLMLMDREHNTRCSLISWWESPAHFPVLISWEVRITTSLCFSSTQHPNCQLLYQHCLQASGISFTVSRLVRWNMQQVPFVLSCPHRPGRPTAVSRRPQVRFFT